MTARLSTEHLKAIDTWLDTSHQQFEELGAHMWHVFRSDKDNKVSTQVRSLQEVVTSATRFSDIADFIKNQMGKTTSSAKPWRLLGEQSLTQLKLLEEKAKGLVQDENLRLEARLRLARGWVRAVVSEYLYAKAQSEGVKP